MGLQTHFWGGGGVVGVALAIFEGGYPLGSDWEWQRCHRLPPQAPIQCFWCQEKPAELAFASELPPSHEGSVGKNVGKINKGP